MENLNELYLAELRAETWSDMEYLLALPEGENISEAYTSFKETEQEYNDASIRLHGVADPISTYGTGKNHGLEA